LMPRAMEARPGGRRDGATKAPAPTKGSRGGD
jgi:hypothetical protein